MIRSDTKRHDGTPVVTQFSTCLVQGRRVRSAAGEGPPARPRAAGGEASAAQFSLAADQTLRYADAARDYSAYTLDAGGRREGRLPAPLVHGMLTLGYAGRAIVEGRAAATRQAEAARAAASPIRCCWCRGQTLTVEAWAGGGRAGRLRGRRQGRACRDQERLRGGRAVSAANASPRSSSASAACRNGQRTWVPTRTSRRTGPPCRSRR